MNLGEKNQKIKLKLKSSYFFFKKGNNHYVYFRGHFFIGEELYEGKKAAEKIMELFPNFPETGFFSYILFINDELYAFVDKVRSYPLFYYFDGDVLVISDILEGNEGELNSKFVINSFWLSGVTLNRETLLKEVYQIEPGTYIKINLQNIKKNEVIINSYFSYRPHYQNISINTYFKVIEQIIKRLIVYANGKRIIIPLSGGLDSRLIVASLKKFNYQNVVCFSYGTSKHSDVKIAKKIAKIAGFKWYFVKYTRKKWKRLLQDERFNHYLNFGANYSSLPHIQDFLVIRELINKKIINGNDIIVPGHTGDFISGGHIPVKYSNMPKVKTTELIEDILGKHFRVNNISKIPSQNLQYLKNIILKDLSIDNKLFIDNNKAAQLIEFFDWKERQSKFIINSVRVYDFFNLSWYLPLWDSEHINYWLNISLKEKINKKLYKTELEKIFPEFFNNITVKKKTLKELTKKHKELFLFYKLLKKMQQYYLSKTKIFRDYYKHPMQWYGLFPFRIVIKKKGFQNINSYLIEYYLCKTIKIENEKNFICNKFL